MLAAVCRKVDRRHQAASASAPSRRLRKGERLAFRWRHAKHVEDHRYKRVVAEDAHELDGRSLAENGTHARERLIADAPRLVELLDEVVDRALVFRRRFRDASLVQVPDRLGFDATAVLKRQWSPSCCASSPKAGACRNTANGPRMVVLPPRGPERIESSSARWAGASLSSARTGTRGGGIFLAGFFAGMGSPLCAFARAVAGVI